MTRRLAVFCLLAVGVAVVFTLALRFGLPLRAIAPPDGVLIGAESDAATDPTRRDLFSGAAQRVVPFQMLYPAQAAGQYAAYVPDAGPLVDAITQSRGWLFRLTLGQIGRLAAPWTDGATPAPDGPYPVILYLPGVTGYMQMGSFQTAALAAQGYVVVTLNQSGAVAAAVLPDGQIVAGLTRELAQALIAPSYSATSNPLPPDFAAALAPDTSIVPYFAADVPLILNRLAQINADPAQRLHGLLNLNRVGVMGMSLGAIVTAQACELDDRIDACLMMDAPVPTQVAAAGLRQPALWISRPAADQRLERTASGGWPEDEIAAQADTIARAVANSDHAMLVLLPGLFHLNFTDIPAIQPLFGWLGQSGSTGVVEGHRQISQLTSDFFAKTIGLGAPR